LKVNSLHFKKRSPQDEITTMQLLRLSLIEIFLLQVAIWLGLWLSSNYLATLLTLIIGAIVSAVLLIALVAEVLERSRVPRRYFYVMTLSVVAPLLAAGIYLALFGGEVKF
jgi:predicted membrane protein